MTGGSGHPKVINESGVVGLDPVPFDEILNEAWLQVHLDRHPEILPINDEIVEAADAFERFQAAGFAGDPWWPSCDLDLADRERFGAIQRALEWVAESVQKAAGSPGTVDAGG